MQNVGDKNAGKYQIYYFWAREKFDNFWCHNTVDVINIVYVKYVSFSFSFYIFTFDTAGKIVGKECRYKSVFH